MNIQQLQKILQENYNRNIILFESGNCWQCSSHKPNTKGYYHITHNLSHGFFTLHREVYSLVNGIILNNNIIRHTCDNPSCINPEHLLQGTHQDNMNDAVERGRQARGERNRHAKLTETEARYIKYSNESIPDLVNRYGITKMMVYGIRTGMYWKHI